MPNATGARHSMEFVKEVTYGVTPAAPDMTPLRHNSVSLALSKDSFQSNELRDDRQIAGYRHGNSQVGGDISSELSFSSFDSLIEAALGGSWSVDAPIAGTDQLKAGTDLGSFTIRRRFTDVGVTQVFTGVKFSNLSLSINSQIATATFSCVGSGMDTVDIPSATIGAKSATDPFSGLDVTTIKEGGIAVGAITELSLSINNGINPTFVLGSPVSGELIAGRSNITGSATYYFQNQTMLNKFLNETESSIEFTLTDPAGNALKFILPRIKYTSSQPDVGGEGEIFLSMPFQALYDVTADSNIVVERTPV